MKRTREKRRRGLDGNSCSSVVHFSNENSSGNGDENANRASRALPLSAAFSSKRSGSVADKNKATSFQSQSQSQSPPRRKDGVKNGENVEMKILENEHEKEYSHLFRMDGRVAPPALWNLMEEYRQTLKCGVCGELPVEATNTDCNHCFCKKCIDDALFEANKCPTCSIPTHPVSLRPYTMGARLVELYSELVKLTSPCDFELSDVEDESDNESEKEDVHVAAEGDKENEKEDLSVDAPSTVQGECDNNDDDYMAVTLPAALQSQSSQRSETTACAPEDIETQGIDTQHGDGDDDDNDDDVETQAGTNGGDAMEEDEGIRTRAAKDGGDNAVVIDLSSPTTTSGGSHHHPLHSFLPTPLPSATTSRINELNAMNSPLPAVTLEDEKSYKTCSQGTRSSVYGSQFINAWERELDQREKKAKKVEGDAEEDVGASIDEKSKTTSEMPLGTKRNVTESSCVSSRSGAAFVECSQPEIRLDDDDDDEEEDDDDDRSYSTRENDGCDEKTILTPKLFSGPAGRMRPRIAVSGLRSTEMKVTRKLCAKLNCEFVGFVKGQMISQGVIPTHVVACRKRPGHTMKLLWGITNGAWVVDIKWVADSLRASTLLEEDAYEIAGSGAFKRARIARSLNLPGIFASLTVCFLPHWTRVTKPAFASKRDISLLLCKNGARVCEYEQVCEILGNYIQFASRCSTHAQSLIFLADHVCPPDPSECEFCKGDTSYDGIRSAVSSSSSPSSNNVPIVESAWVVKSIMAYERLPFHAFSDDDGDGDAGDG